MLQGTFQPMLAAAQVGSSSALSREQLVEWIVACALIVVGLSLLLRARIWIAALAGAASHPLTPLLSGLYALLMGLVVVLSHNLWVKDLRVLVTLLGWLALVSGAVLLIIPEVYSYMLRRIPITPQLIALRGFIRLVLGGAIVSYLLTQAG